VFQHLGALEAIYPRLGILTIISVTMFCVIIFTGQSVENMVISEKYYLLVSYLQFIWILDEHNFSNECPNKVV
jgi:hypothetical protein